MATAGISRFSLRERQAARESPMEQFFVFLQKNPMNMVLFGTVLVTAGMLVWPLVGRLIRPGRDVGPVEAVQLINRRDAVVLDVRDAADYKAGHITNARHIPEKDIESRMKELEKLKSKPIIVSCARGNRSTSVANRLAALGFGEVFSLRGGIAAWQQANMPLEKS
jgi:rhodanese-related sulfurtransferase